MKFIKVELFVGEKKKKEKLETLLANHISLAIALPKLLTVNTIEVRWQWMCDHMNN